MNDVRNRVAAVLCALAMVALLLTTGATVARAFGGRQTTTDAQITNFDRSAPTPAGHPYGGQVVKLDTEGNSIDAQEEYITHFGNNYYLYGDSFDCTYMFFPQPGFCGFRVYQSRDLVHWTNDGRFVEPATSTYAKDTCGGPTACWGPQVIYNQTTQKYLLWFYRATGAPTNQPLVVMEGSSPTGPWINPTYPDVPAGYSPEVFGDHDGNAYLAWGGPASGLSVQKLNSSYTEVVGPETIVTRPSGTLFEPKCQPPGGLFGPDGANQTPALQAAWKACGLNEAPSMVRHGNRYYMVFSNPICAFCHGTETAYFVAESPLGPWHGVNGSPSYDPSQPGVYHAYQLSPDTCEGQSYHIDHLPTIDGGELDLFGATHWENSKNEGSANHYWEPLRFRAGLLMPLQCGNFTVPLAERVPVPEPQPKAIDLAAVAAGSSLSQTMIAPTTGTITSIELPLYQKTNPSSAIGNESLVSQPLTVTLSGPGGSATATLAPNEVSWSPTRVQLGLHVPVLAGDRLALTLSSTTPEGRYGTLFEAHWPYPSGSLTGSGEAVGLVGRGSDILFRAIESTMRGSITFGA